MSSFSFSLAFYILITKELFLQADYVRQKNKVLLIDEKVKSLRVEHRPSLVILNPTPVKHTCSKIVQQSTCVGGAKKGLTQCQPELDCVWVRVEYMLLSYLQD
ncbi:MAG: hypothetical protein PHX18_00440 [Candidatus Gastranaerophilales bacterium]|nr:hypothetical protein [Candidatus Gastranaerophilales bacterium]